jgi:hypothetical protein
MGVAIPLPLPRERLPCKPFDTSAPIQEAPLQEKAAVAQKKAAVMQEKAAVMQERMTMKMSAKLE